MTIVRSADCTEIITVMTKMVTSCVTAVPVRLIHMREVKKMTEKDLDVAIEKCERIMEMDARTMQNPVSENGWIFEKVYELLQYLRQFQYVSDTNVGDMISRQAAIKAVHNYWMAEGYKLPRKMVGGYEVLDGDDKSQLRHNKMICNAIKALPSAQPGWIPCSRELPKPNEEDGNGFYKAYLVQDGRWMDVARWDGKYWVAWGYSTVLLNVVAWQPLPKPYREGGQGNV